MVANERKTGLRGSVIGMFLLICAVLVIGCGQPASKGPKKPAKEKEKMAAPAKEKAAEEKKAVADEKKPAAAAEKKPAVDEKYRPKLLVELPEELNTPDGMRLDKKTGNLIVSCPNLSDTKFPAKLIKITPENKWEMYFDKLPKHPETGFAAPMGLDFGPDGNLYYADNQYFNDKDKKHYWSRIVRVNVKDGKPVSADVVVDGFKLSNAVMFKGDVMYVSDTFFDLPGKNASGVYAIPLADMKKGVVMLKPKGEKDPYLLTTFETKPLAVRKNDIAGADGMTFDSKGNLYVGHFGDGQLHKITLNDNGTLKSSEVVAQAPKLTCCDGMFCDVKTDKVYIADSALNAIQVFDTKDNSVTTLWENDDTDGSLGLLDQPCEPAIRGDELIICNFDMPFPGLKNTKYDKPHTISVIKLK